MNFLTMFSSMLLVIEMNGISAAIIFGLVGVACAIGMALSISKSADAISRQPGAESKIRAALMIGLVFIESIAIYAMFIVILLLVL